MSQEIQVETEQVTTPLSAKIGPEVEQKESDLSELFNGMIIKPLRMLRPNKLEEAIRKSNLPIAWNVTNVLATEYQLTFEEAAEESMKLASQVRMQTSYMLSDGTIITEKEYSEFFQSLKRSQKNIIRFKIPEGTPLGTAYEVRVLTTEEARSGVTVDGKLRSRIAIIQEEITDKYSDMFLIGDGNPDMQLSNYAFTLFKEPTYFQPRNFMLTRIHPENSIYGGICLSLGHPSDTNGKFRVLANGNLALWSTQTKSWVLADIPTVVNHLNDYQKNH